MLHMGLLVESNDCSGAWTQGKVDTLRKKRTQSVLAINEYIGFYRNRSPTQVPETMPWVDEVLGIISDFCSFKLGKGGCH